METMMGYIRESVAQCLENIEHAKQLTQQAVDTYCEQEYHQLLAAASGSSYNATVSARYFVEAVLKTKMEVVTSYTYCHYEHYTDRQSLVFGVGQSGRSKNTNDALDKARSLGMKTIGVSGNEESVMKEHCDLILNWGVGIEKIGYVTKGFTTLVLWWMLFALEAGLRKQTISEAEYDRYKEQLKEACALMEKAIEKGEALFEANRDELIDLKRVQAMGAGATFGTALETGLKLAETTEHACNGYELEEFLHGPSLETDENRTLFFFDAGGSQSEHMIDVFNGMHELTERVYLVTNKHIDDPKALVLEHDLPEIITPLFMTIFPQIVAAKGNDLCKHEYKPKWNAMMDKIGYKAPKTGKEKGL